MWRFRVLRRVCRRFRGVLDGILMEKEAGGNLLAAAVQCRVHLGIWMHHRRCTTWGYTADLHKGLLTIAAEAKTAEELCELLINITYESPPSPTLTRMLMVAAAGVAYDPEHRERLRQLEADDSQTNFSPLSVELVGVATARKLVREVAASIMVLAGRRGRARLTRESASATRWLVDSVIVDPADPNISIIAWAGLQENFGAILDRDPKRKIFPDRLRSLCIRWLLATSVEAPPASIAAAFGMAPFGTALKFLMAVDLSRPLQDSLEAATALCADTALAHDTALAVMMTVVLDEYRRAATNPWEPKPKPCLTGIMLAFWKQFGYNRLPPLLACTIGEQMAVRVYRASDFHCSSPDCGYWALL